VCQDPLVLPVHQENGEIRGIEDQKESGLRDLWDLEVCQVLALNIFACELCKYQAEWKIDNKSCP
jgi:hypothetical protein